jgi:transcriptional regulator with XRE-family HTH domain
MDVEKVSEFTSYVGQLCAQREIDIYLLADRLTMDPTELLRMINGRLKPTHEVLAGLARELHADGRQLEKLAEEIRED